MSAAPSKPQPVDPYDGSLPPPARTVEGEIVTAVELDAAAEIVRSARKLGLRPGVIDGFTAHRIYRRLRSRIFDLPKVHSPGR